MGTTTDTSGSGTGPPPSCGNGVVEPGEECDDGNIINFDECLESCKLASCGDGYLGPGEECDDGNQVNDDSCTSDCVLPECTDGIVQRDEECDDGNLDDTDGCTSQCLFATCGDGYTWAGQEECDDANTDDTDACLSTCVLPSCGDGHVWFGQEECDDANGDDTDACLTTCMAASCGDGFIWAGVETCEDGNLDNTDSCTTLCLAPSCTDTIVSGDETSVDCGGSCGGCQAGHPCLVNADCAGGQCNGFQCSGASMVTTGGHHTCALLEQGTVRCWGWGGEGELGYANPENIGDDELPAAAGDVNVGGSATFVEAGWKFTCAVLVGGAVRCWGQNDWGQLGYGHTMNIGDWETPASAGDLALGDAASRVVLGSDHACVLLESGAIRCWGAASYGQLGAGNTTRIGDDETVASAVDVDHGGGTVVSLDAGHFHNCVLIEGGTVRCWGAAWDGALGYGNLEAIGDDELPSAAGEVDVGGVVTQLVTGGYHTCALLQGGTVRCWGRGDNGQLGYGNQDEIGDDETPASAGDVDIGGVAVEIQAGVWSTCAFLQGGTLRCWGANNWGHLGYGHEEVIGDDETPANAGDVEVGDTVTQLAMGASHTCALMEGGAIRCWGRGAYGRLGYGNQDDIGDDELPWTAGEVPFQ